MSGTLTRKKRPASKRSRPARATGAKKASAASPATPRTQTPRLRAIATGPTGRRSQATVAPAAATATAESNGNGPGAVRDRCLDRYLPLVRYVVERVAASIPKHVDHEDLYSAGVFGLLNAYDKFDKRKGTKFETYAVWRIRGAVLDQLRSLDWASRSTRRMGREVESTARALDQKLGRTASDEEIASAMRMSLDDYHRLVDKVRGSVLVSLDESRGGEEGDALGLAELLEDPAVPDALNTIEEEETKHLLLAALNRLPEQERLVVALYYYEQMTLREIGEAMGISESRVSQVHTRAVERLRGRVQRSLDG